MSRTQLAGYAFRLKTVTIMSSSRSQEDTYEAQNDQRLDELHSKIRSLRGVCSLCGPHSYSVLPSRRYR